MKIVCLRLEDHGPRRLERRHRQLTDDAQMDLQMNSVDGSLDHARGGHFYPLARGGGLCLSSICQRDPSMSMTSAVFQTETPTMVGRR